MPEFKIIDTGEVRIRAAIEGAGPLVLLVHGFPESWYSWRHQLVPIAQAGFCAAAIDVRGYGGSDKPVEVAAYDMEHLTADIVAVARTLQPDAPAILVGHDWGAPIVWNAALSRPGMFRGAAGLSVPFTGAPKRPFTDVIRETFTEKGLFFYQAWFQELGLPEAEAEADVGEFLRKFFYGVCGDAPEGSWLQRRRGWPLLRGMPDPEPFPAWLTPADLDYYVREFSVSGFFGPISRYRNHERDYAWLRQFQGRRLDLPTLLIGGDRDPAFTLFGCIADPEAAMRRHASDLRQVATLKGCGHWTQQERPVEVNEVLVSWLKQL